MYEEYLEDYVYRLMSKIASRICLMFKPKKNTSNTSVLNDTQESTSIENLNDNIISPEDNKKVKGR